MGRKRAKAGSLPADTESQALPSSKSRAAPTKPRPSNSSGASAVKNETVLHDPDVRALAKKADDAFDVTMGAARSELVKRRAKLESLIEQLETSSRALAVDLAIWKGELAQSQARRDKLEELCRMLQNQTRYAAEETVNSAVTDSERCKKLQNDFESAVEDVRKRLDLQNKQCDIQVSENEALAKKLAAYSSQWQLREEHRSAEERSRKLKIQLGEAKVAQARQLLAHEELKQRSLREELNARLDKTTSLRQQTQVYLEKVNGYESNVSNNAALWPDLERRYQEMKALSESVEADNKEQELCAATVNATLAQMAELHHMKLARVAEAKKINDRLVATARTLQARRDSVTKALEGQTGDELGKNLEEGSPISQIDKVGVEIRKPIWSCKMPLKEEEEMSLSSAAERAAAEASIGIDALRWARKMKNAAESGLPLARNLEGRSLHRRQKRGPSKESNGGVDRVVADLAHQMAKSELSNF